MQAEDHLYPTGDLLLDQEASGPLASPALDLIGHRQQPCAG